MARRKTSLEFITEAKEIHRDKYDYSKVVYINTKTKVVIDCNIHGEFQQTPKAHLKGNGGCQECRKILISEIMKITNEEFDLFLVENNLKIKRIDDYSDTETKINFLCLVCNNMWKTAPHYIKDGGGCVECWKNKKLAISQSLKSSNEDIDKFLIDNDIKIKRIGEYTLSNIKLDLECLICHHIWGSRPNDIKRGKGCPLCLLKNEKIIYEYLRKVNICFSYHHKIFNKDKNIFVDFYISLHNLIIEYNGSQHYKPVRFGNRSSDEAKRAFEKQTKRDNALRLYCKNNNINLIEIDGRTYFGNALKKYLKNYFEPYLSSLSDSDISACSLAYSSSETSSSS
jgi:hypothetical protein